MDLAVYIGELLGLQGEVSLPGIGYFWQIRINGYYNEAENKFYPPAHEVSFRPQSKDNEGLAKYIAGKKNISLASSKYFIEKYVTGIMQEVASKKVEIAGLGYLYTNDTELAFTADYRANDPSFYGLPAVNIPQPEENPVINYSSAGEEEIPVKEQAKEIAEKPLPTIIHREAVPAEETQAEQEQEYQYDEPEESGRRNLWVALLLVIIIVLLAVLGLYKYKPSWFDRSESLQTYVAVNPDTASKDSNTDTTISALKQDSAVKTAGKTPATLRQTINSPADTFATLHYELLGGAFKTLPQTNAAVANYQKLGLQPRILKHTPGNSYKITLGTYFNKDKAQKAQDSILSATKINKANIYLQQYTPKK
ncbi:MAG: hypothetical protein JWP78_3246 [Mucilaginibacter sp.]|nr:hypothetical protein [Mucilaginibacter sp.]